MNIDDLNSKENFAYKLNHTKMLNHLLVIANLNNNYLITILKLEIELREILIGTEKNEISDNVERYLNDIVEKIEKISENQMVDIIASVTEID